MALWVFDFLRVDTCVANIETTQIIDAAVHAFCRRVLAVKTKVSGSVRDEITLVSSFVAPHDV